MMERIKRMWQGSYPPWAIAGAFAALAMVMVIGFPLGASAKQIGGQTNIGQPLNDGVPPDIATFAKMEQPYDSAFTIDTSQYTLATTCLTAYGGSGSGVETPTYIATATTRHVSDAPIATAGIAPGHGTQVPLDRTPTVPITS